MSNSDKIPHEMTTYFLKLKSTILYHKKYPVYIGFNFTKYYFLFSILFFVCSCIKKEYEDKEFIYSKSQLSILRQFQKESKLTYLDIKNDNYFQLHIEDSITYLNNKEGYFINGAILKEITLTGSVTDKESLTQNFSLTCSVEIEDERIITSVIFSSLPGNIFILEDKMINSLSQSIELNGVTFKNVYTIREENISYQTDFVEIYISTTKGIIGFKGRNDDIWMITDT